MKRLSQLYESLKFHQDQLKGVAEYWTSLYEQINNLFM